MEKINRPETGWWYATQTDANFPELDVFDSGTSIASRFILDHGPSTYGNRKQPNPWSWTRESVSYPTGNWVQRSLYSPRAAYSATGLAPQLSQAAAYLSHTSDDVVSMDSLCYNDMLEQLVEKVRGGVDLSIDAVQHKQAKALFKSLFDLRRLHKEGLDLIFGNLGLQGKARKRRYVRTKIIADRWLEYQYGLAPTMSTIFGILDNNLVAPGFSGRIVRAKARRTLSRSDSDTSMVFPGHGSFSSSETAFVEYRSKIKLKVRSSDAVDPRRWTSLNPASIVWEAIPYSFVADWVFDVGSYLRNYETAVLYAPDFVEGYVSVLRSHSRQNSDSGFFRGGSDSYAWNATCSRVNTDFNRIRLYSTPLPRPPVFNLGGFIGSGLRLLNGAALLAGDLARRKFK